MNLAEGQDSDYEIASILVFLIYEYGTFFI